MKMDCHFLRGFRCRAAFTLTEILTAMAVFSLVVVALVYSHLLGLRMYNITAAKLGASAGARAVLNRVGAELRSAKTFYVGNGNEGGFTNVAGNRPRQGNALQLYPGADTNTFVRYYLDPDLKALLRVSSSNREPVVLAPYLTNQIAFAAEDYWGNVLTNDVNNRVVRMTLEFYQWEFPVASAGGGAFYDYYRLQTRITRRTIE